MLSCSPRSAQGSEYVSVPVTPPRISNFVAVDGFVRVCPDLQVVYTYAQGLQWCLQMARGLERLHTSSPIIIHRDLKLENILLAGAHFEVLQTCGAARPVAGDRPSLKQKVAFLLARFGS